MPRNFYRRVEVMFPIEQADLRDRILHEIVPAYLKDNVKARVLQPDGVFTRPPLAEGDTPFRVQERLLGVTPATAVSGEMPLISALGTNGNGPETMLGGGRPPIPAAVATDENGISGNTNPGNAAEGNGSAHSSQPVPNAGDENP